MLRTLAAAVFVASCLTIVHTKKVEGTIREDSNWEFLTRFCFLSTEGSMEYEFEYPVGYGTQEIYLYYDTPGQWDSIYKRGKSCEEKRSVLSISSNQIIALNTSYTQTSRYSGCTLVNRGGDVWYQCRQSRTFRSMRERWWFIAFGRCDAPKDADKSGLYLKYYIHMTNGDDLLHEEYSADEFYILPIDIVFFLIYIFLCAISLVCTVMLIKKQLFHTTYKMYLVALFLWMFHLLLMVIAWGSYGDSGWEIKPVEVTGRIIQSCSNVTFILMLILMAKGYTITRGKLTQASAIKITVFMCVYCATIITLFIWEGMLFDAGKVLYYYESPPGYGMITMRLIGWLWFLYATIFTLKHHISKAKFYIPFFSFYTIWFWAGPVVTLIAMHAMAKWSREKTVNGVEQFVGLCGHLFFLVLTRPSAANDNFPYHVRTSQIGVLGDGEDGETTPDGRYAVSTSVHFNGTGPNLDIFVTTHSEKAGYSASDRLYAPLDVTSGDSPPPSYPQAMAASSALPPIGGFTEPSPAADDSSMAAASEDVHGAAGGSHNLPNYSNFAAQGRLPPIGSSPGEEIALPPIRGTGLPSVIPSAPPPSYADMFLVNK